MCYKKYFVMKAAKKLDCKQDGEFIFYKGTPYYVDIEANFVEKLELVKMDKIPRKTLKKITEIIHINKTINEDELNDI